MRFFGCLLLLVGLVACNTTTAPTQPDRSLNIRATLVSANPPVHSVVPLSPNHGRDSSTRTDDVEVTVNITYDVRGLVNGAMVQPRLLCHEAGDPTTMYTPGLAFPQGNLYMELPPSGQDVVITFSGDMGGRFCSSAVAGRTIDYALFFLLYERPDGEFDDVCNINGSCQLDEHRAIRLDWRVQ